MTITQQTSADIDEARIGELAGRIFGEALSTMELTITHLGRVLGLYEALRGRPATSGELARTAAIDERYAREWLEHQAVNGTLAVDDPAAGPQDRRYRLPEEHAVVLLDEEHPAHVGALADIIRPISLTLDALTDAFRTGEGVAYAAYALHGMQAGSSRPAFANLLVQDWLPALPDVQARLEAGEALRIADFGCGEGWAAIYLAEAYPKVTVDGFDLDDSSVAAARKHASDRGVADRVRFEVQDITDERFGDRYDLAFATEVVHDLADPVGALAAMRRVTRDGGTVLIVDERAEEEFSAPGDEMQRLLYAFSVLHCLPAGRTERPSAETGTVMRPSTLADYASRAGFGRTTVLPVEHEMFRLYQLS